MDRLIRKDVADDVKCRQMQALLPRPLALVKPFESLTRKIQKIELQGEVPLCVTFTEFIDFSDLKDLGECRFWPDARTPYGWGQNTITASDTESEDQEEPPSADIRSLYESLYGTDTE